VNLLQRYLTAEYLFPAAFWLLPAVALVVLLPLLRGKRTLAVSLLRACCLSLIVLALADPVHEQSSEEQEISVLLDMSYSVSPRARQALINQLRPYLSGSTSAAVFPFGRNISRKALEIPAGEDPVRALAEVEDAAKDVDTGETNIAAALSAVMARSESSSILLLSDGQETLGNAAQLAQAAAQRGVRLFPLLPNEDVFSKERLSVSSLYAPVTAHAGDTIEVRSAVANSYNAAAGGKFELWIDNEKLYSQQISVPAGQEKLIVVKTPAAKGGLHRIRAVLNPDHLNAADEKTGGLERHRWVSVKEKAKILLLSGTKEDGRLLKQLITQKGYNLEDVIADGSREIPQNFESISEVILNNVARRQLPPKFLELLETFVKGGGGLLLVGGERSFGLGGYIDTLLEEMSPVKFVPPQTEKRRLNNAVVLVIDKSGSMADENKIEAAKSAALASIDSLKDEDFVSVIGFDAGPFVIIDVEPVAQAKRDAARRLRNLTAAGKTNLLPALAVARQRLQKAGASRKHIIVLSDGKFPLSSEAYISEINALRAEGISVSAVALGIEADVPFMKILAKYGKGAFYHTLDASQLPKIFVEDIKVSTGEKTLQEGIDLPVGVGPAGVRSSSIQSYPPVRGFVETLPKKGSDLELITRREDRIFPIMGSWKYGNGKVIAYTSDANGRWSLPWVEWREFAVFWSQLIEGIRNQSGVKSGDIDFDLRYSVERKSVVFDLAVYDDALRTELAPRVTADIVEPGGEEKRVSFQSTKKGRFEAHIENGRPGDYKLKISYGSTKLPDMAVTLGGELFGEVQGKGANISLLENLAYLTSGKINPDPKEVQGFSRISRNKQHLLLPLLALAFAFLLFEAFVRERGWGFFRPRRVLRRKSLPVEPKAQARRFGEKRRVGRSTGR
jgi:uncharacterized membrane protein